MFLALPKCAQPCTINALTAGGCDLFNATAVAECSCTNVPLKAGMSLCVQDNCPWADQKSKLPVAAVMIFFFFSCGFLSFHTDLGHLGPPLSRSRIHIIQPVQGLYARVAPG